MKTSLRKVSFLVVVLSALGLFALPALALAPANDTFAGAKLVTGGISETLDTTEATTDADDAQLNAYCGAWEPAASVWYAIEGSGGGVIVDVSASSYEAFVLVGTGAQGSLTGVACGYSGVNFFAEAGTTYYILVVDDNWDGGSSGGLLSISFSEIPPPLNDDFGYATSVTEPLPFFDSINTDWATAAADDPDCYGNGNTVWYSYTATQDIEIEADTFGSDYNTTLSVYTGLPGSLTMIACNDDYGFGQHSQVSFAAVAGETYYFMVGSYYYSWFGGNLVFHVDEFVPFTAELQIAPKGSFNKAGTATIRGIVTCSRPAFVGMWVEVRQNVGRVVIFGESYINFECDGETAWEIQVSGYNGRFAGGAVSVSLSGSAYDPIPGDSIAYEETVVVRLRK